MKEIEQDLKETPAALAQLYRRNRVGSRLRALMDDGSLVSRSEEEATTEPKDERFLHEKRRQGDYGLDLIYQTPRASRTDILEIWSVGEYFALLGNIMSYEQPDRRYAYESAPRRTGKSFFRKRNSAAIFYHTYETSPIAADDDRILDFGISCGIELCWESISAMTTQLVRHIAERTGCSSLKAAVFVLQNTRHMTGFEYSLLQEIRRELDQEGMSVSLITGPHHVLNRR